MDVRRFSEDPGLSDEVRRFLNLALPKDFISRRLFSKLTNGDPNYDPRFCYAAVSGGEVKAVAIGVRRVKEPASMVEAHRSVAWIKMLAVAKGCENMLHEALEALEEDFAKEGRKHIRVSDYPCWYLTPGVDVEYENLLNVLTERGYSKAGETVNYEVDLSRFYVPLRVNRVKARLEEEGVVVKEAEGSLGAAGEWIEKTFSPFWRVEAEMALKEPDGGVLVAEKGGETIGFSVYGAIRPDFFGPIGVDPGFRGKGLGTFLLFETLKRMRWEGVRIATIPWTSHLFFYTQLPGVAGVRHFVIMAKTLP